MCLAGGVGDGDGLGAAVGDGLGVGEGLAQADKETTRRINIPMPVRTLQLFDLFPFMLPPFIEIFLVTV